MFFSLVLRTLIDFVSMENLKMGIYFSDALFGLGNNRNCIELANYRS